MRSNGFVATATVGVVGGVYRLSGVISGGGYRVTVDGKVVLTHAWPERVHRQSEVIRLPAGKHDFQVEAYHLFGPTTFDLELVPEP